MFIETEAEESEDGSTNGAESPPESVGFVPNEGEDHDEDEELEEIDELDEDELKALEEFREKRELAEHFDSTLGEREKKYNKYVIVP